MCGSGQGRGSRPRDEWSVLCDAAEVLLAGFPQARDATKIGVEIVWEWDIGVARNGVKVWGSANSGSLGIGGPKAQTAPQRP